MDHEVSELICCSSSLGKGGRDTKGVSVWKLRDTNEFYVLKRYTSDSTANVRWDEMASLIDKAKSFERGEDSRMWTAIAWPTGILYEKGTCVGVLEHFQGHADSPGNEDAEWAKYGTINSCQYGCCRNTWLTLDWAQMQKTPGAVYFEFPVKLQRLGILFLIVEELHKYGICVGDLKTRNVLVQQPGKRCPDVEPIYIVDTDSFWVNGVSPNPNKPSDRFGSELGTQQHDNEALAHAFFDLLNQRARSGIIGLDKNKCSRLLPWAEVEEVEEMRLGIKDLSSLHMIALNWARLESLNGKLHSAVLNGVLSDYKAGMLESLVKDCGY